MAFFSHHRKVQAATVVTGRDPTTTAEDGRKSGAFDEHKNELYSRHMRNEGGLIFSCRSGRADQIRNAISRDDRFTDVVETGEGLVTRPEIILVALDDDRIEYVGVIESGRRVVTGQKTIAISHLTPVDIDIEELLAKLPSKFSPRISFGGSGVDRLPPATWNALLGAVTEEREVSTALKRTNARIKSLQNLRVRGRDDLGLFEHDAVAVALETWGGTRERKRRLRSAAAPIDENAPFLERLGAVDLREDPQINHDAQTLPGMAVARRYQTGIAVLENAQERLTIINCNRQPLEETLGVDLIYYNHVFKSFVLVQYKRMKRNSKGESIYRPDSDASYADEFKRMKSVSTELGTIKCTETRTVSSFRLGTGAFYFKLCSDSAANATAEGMASGMYLPLRLWRSLLRSKETKGPRGGRLVSWDNCRRRFNNSQFTTLLRGGWIGSSPTQSLKLHEIIEKALGSKRAVVYAATSASSSSEDYRRDDLGRFASEDDPFASD